MKRFFPEDQSYWLLVPTVLYHCVPILQSYVTGYAPFFFFSIWLVCQGFKRSVSVDLKSKRYYAWTLFFYFLYIFTPPIYGLFGHGEFWVPMAQPLNNIAPFIVLYISLRRARYQELVFLLFVAFAGLFFAGMAAFKTRGMELEGARSMVVMSYEKASADMKMAGDDAMSLGLGGYSFMYVCAFLVPAFFVGFFLVKGTLMRCLIVVEILTLIICIRSGGLGTPVFVVAFGVMCALFATVVRFNLLAKLFPLLGVVALTVYIASPPAYSFLSGPLLAAAEHMEEGGSIRKRFETLADACSGNLDAYANGRYDLQRRSFKTFCESPIFGIGDFANQSRYSKSVQTDWKIGRHSFFIDMMARRGVIGVLPYLLFLVFLFKYLRRISAVLWGERCMLMCYVYLSAYIFAGIANPIPIMPATFYIILPGLAILSNKNILYGNVNRPFARGYYS